MNGTDPLEDLTWLWWLLALTAAVCIPMLIFGWWERKCHLERFEYEIDDYDDSRDCCGGGVHEEWR